MTRQKAGEKEGEEGGEQTQRVELEPEGVQGQPEKRGEGQAVEIQREEVEAVQRWGQMVVDEEEREQQRE